MKRWLLLLLAVLSLSGCGYNDFQRMDEQSKAAWSEVLSQYQRRADLVPNIVATVKGEAAFEQETLTRVIEARAKATSIQVTPETLNNPEAFQKFQAAQGELGSALSRLMVVSEQYPNLKANQGFADLRVTLEGTENRITVARGRYIKTIEEYNVLARSFPSNLTAMVFSYSPNRLQRGQRGADLHTPDRRFQQEVKAMQGRVAGQGPPPRLPCVMLAMLARALLLTSVLCRELRGRAGRAAGAGPQRARHRHHRHAGRRQTAITGGRGSRRWKRAKGAQVVVLMVPTTQPEDIAVTRTGWPTPGRSAGVMWATACC
jgi:LemA protein